MACSWAIRWPGLSHRAGWPTDVAGGFHHPGDTVSVTCLKELVIAAEAQTKIRPRRRTDLVAQRIQTQAQTLAGSNACGTSKRRRLSAIKRREIV